MNKKCRLKKTPVYRFLFAGIVSSCLVLLAGCSQQPATPSPDTASAVNWVAPDDQQAKAWLAACETDFKKAEHQFKALEQGKFPAASGLLNAINDLDITLDGRLSQASLHANVNPNAQVRDVARTCQQNFVTLLSDISLSRPLYNHLVEVDQTALNPLDKRFVEKMIRDYRRSGVDKSEEVRTRIRQLNEEINLIGQAFNKNILEDTRKITVDSEAELAGLPADYIAARQRDEEGRLIITTDYPDYVPMTQYAENDELRKKLYVIFRQRAYPDNKAVLMDLIQKRHELAQLLGYANYAAYITEDKMIQSPGNSSDFIDRVFKLAEPRAKAEYKVLLERMQKINPQATRVEDWQKAYLENLVKKEKYQIDSQAVRQYFQYDKVRQGIFKLTEDMFQVSIRPWNTGVWHESVNAYEIVDKDKVIGRFFLDMHPRDGKYKHAAAFTLQDGVRDRQLPIYALVCNFPGGDGSSGLMEHSDVETFLHEFGHLLHGIFAGNQPWLAFSGIRTEWDFVEAPSQMLEEWVWDMETLATFATNDKGETIPPALVNKMIAGRDFGKGMWTQHQLFYAALSLGVYNTDPANLDLDKLTAELQARYSPFGYVDDTYFYASFGHLHGYSAIYYTYMWSLVIAADMYSEFAEHGLRNPEIAQRYRHYVMEPGGSKDAADLVKDFLGREYSFDAFAEELNHD